MNMDVNKVNEVSKYVQDYMEVHGKSTGDDAAGYTLDAATLDHINSHVSRYGMTAAVTYDTATSGNVYYKLELKYALKMPFLNLNANHTYDAIARTPKTAQGSDWGKRDLEKAEPESVRVQGKIM